MTVPHPSSFPGQRNAPFTTNLENLLNLYPNSFDRLGSLMGEYDIKVDPTVPPVQHTRRKVPIESKAAIEEAIDYMVKQDILKPQMKPTPWVSSVTYPVKSTGEVRPCLDARDLNKAIIHENHKPQTVEGNCLLAGWDGSLHKGRHPQGLSTATPHQGKW